MRATFRLPLRLGCRPENRDESNSVIQCPEPSARLPGRAHGSQPRNFPSIRLPIRVADVSGFQPWKLAETVPSHHDCHLFGLRVKCRVTSTIEPRNLHLRISKNRRFWVLSAGNGGDIRSEWVCYFFAGGEKVESPHKHAPPSVDAAHEYQNASLTFRLLHAHRASPRAHRRQTPRPRRHARRRLRQEVQRKALARRRH